MIQRILSIDIDCVMEPCILLYDDSVSGSRVEPMSEWSQITPPDGGYSLCAKRWALVKKIYTSTQARHVVFSNHHHHILDVLPEGPLEIYNLDHHHDVEYPGWNDDLPLHEGNWVGWLAKKKRIAHYTWYRNKNSEDIDPAVTIDFDYREVQLPDVEVPAGPYDVLFVCLSPNWMPPEFWSLRNELVASERTYPAQKMTFLDESPEYTPSET